MRDGHDVSSRPVPPLAPGTVASAVPVPLSHPVSPAPAAPIPKADPTSLPQSRPTPEAPAPAVPQPSPVAASALTPAATQRRPWWARASRSVGRGLGLTAAGAFCCVGWLVAIVAHSALALPADLAVPIFALLLLAPPLLILLLGTIRARPPFPQAALALLLLLVAAVPTVLFPPPRLLTPTWLAHAPLLMPAFDAGLAIGFAWPRARSRSSKGSVWGAGLRAAGFGALGFALTILALIGVEAFLVLYLQRPCTGLTCVPGYLSLTFLALLEVYGAGLALLLALAGGAVGALLRSPDADNYQ